MLTWKDFLALCRKTKLSIAKLNGTLSSILAMKSMFPTVKCHVFNLNQQVNLWNHQRKQQGFLKHLLL